MLKPSKKLQKYFFKEETDRDELLLIIYLFLFKALHKSYPNFHQDMFLLLCILHMNRVVLVCVMDRFPISLTVRNLSLNF